MTQQNRGDKVFHLKIMRKGKQGRVGGGGDHFHQLSRHASRQAAEVEVKRNDENAKILLDKENETNVEEKKKR
jgi:hypothetical protein